MKVAVKDRIPTERIEARVTTGALNNNERAVDLDILEASKMAQIATTKADKDAIRAFQREQFDIAAEYCNARLV